MFRFSKALLAFMLVAVFAICQNTPVKVDTGDTNTDRSLIKLDPPEQVAKRLEWFTEARFGMFIHWGLYSQNGCHWKGLDGKTEHMMRHLQIPLREYEKIADEFDPEKFNADEWASIAKNAGMKYMIITAKHHDGFAMFNSKSSSYNIVVRTPFARDPIQELADAARRQGLRFGVYYSLGRDWEDPDVPTKDGYRSNTWDYPDETKKDFSKYFERKVKPQIRELLTQYGSIDVLWFDTPEKISRVQSEELAHLVHSIQPNTIINQRVGNRLGDYRVAEQNIPDAGYSDPWETCMTMNKHWGYYLGDENWKSTETLVRNLIDVASKNGNFLLNVGPTGAGVIPRGSVQHLEEIGDWLKVNGEAIYGTTASPLPKPEWGRFTQKTTAPGTTLYLHVFDWPKDGKLLVPGVKNAADSATILGGGSKLPMQATGAGLVISLPAAAPDKISSTIVLKFRGAVKKAN